MNRTLSAVIDLLKTSRPISWPNTAYPFAAAYIMNSHRVTAALIIGSLFFLIPYNLLMYGINDVFDYESDLRNPRKGGVEGAVLDRARHKIVLVASIGLALPFVAWLLTLGSVGAKLVLAYSIFMVVAYSAPRLRCKERPFLDSFTSSTHFVSPMVYGLVLTGWHNQYWPYVLAFFAWGMASHAFGAVQDITADRQAGISSIGTVFGAAWTTRVSGLLYLACIGILAVQNTGARVVAVVAALYLANITPYGTLSDDNCEQAHAGWQRFLLLNWLSGFVVTLVLITVFRHGN